MKEALLKGLSEQQIAKAKACHNSAELLELAEAEGVELTEEQLLAISGGACTSTEDDNQKETDGHRKIES